MVDRKVIAIQQLPAFLPAIEFIRQEEGLRLTVYLCPAGVKTVGWGHAVEPNDGLDLGDAITEERAAQFLEADIIKAFQSLFRLTCVPLDDTQQIALVSFIFNLGAGRFQASTLRQKINRGEFEAAEEEFGRWIYARDPVRGLLKLNGLAARRRREQMLFLGEITQRTSLKPRPDTLPFKYNKPYSSMPKVSRTVSNWQKAEAICMKLFRQACNFVGIFRIKLPNQFG